MRLVTSYYTYKKIKKSTKDAGELLTNTVFFFSLDNNQCCTEVFLDHAKAFDTFSTQLLLRKLGIRGQFAKVSHLHPSSNRGRIGYVDTIVFTLKFVEQKSII